MPESKQEKTLEYNQEFSLMPVNHPPMNSLSVKRVSGSVKHFMAPIPCMTFVAGIISPQALISVSWLA